MIEPFCQLLFRGAFDSLSPISNLFVTLLSRLVDFSELSSSIVALIVFVILLYFFKNAFAYLSQWVMASLRSDLLYSLRNQLYRKIVHLPLSYFNSKKRGDLVSRAVTDTQEVQNTILNSIKTFITEPFAIIFYLIFLFYISVRLSLYALALLPATFLLIGMMSSSLRRMSRNSKQQLGTLLSHVEETLSGLRIIKGFNSQQNATQVFKRLNKNYANSQTRICRLVDLASPLSEFFGVVVVMIILVIGGSLVLSKNSNLTAELFITYIALFTQIITPLKNISTAFSNFKRGQAALDRYYEVIDAQDTIRNAVNAYAVKSFNDSITFSNVSFSYDTAEVISQLNFQIRKGQTVAFVGQSGAGKSTLVDLLERFYDPTVGSILLDGVDIKSLDINSYRSLFSLVSQDVVLFNDTLYENVVMGMEGVTEQDVIEALKVANIYDFVSSLPEGLAYNVGDRGVNLSGGQRQRISIARAVLRNSPVLLLDEATSAMDTESEKLVQEALDRVVQNRTVIVVAHRLSTIQQADVICVMDKGKMVECGTHQQLLDLGGVYSKLVKIQTFN